MLRPILFHLGAPEMMHDWIWPLTRNGVRSMALDFSAITVPTNWDSAAWMPRVNLLSPMLIIGSLILSPPLLLKAYLAATVLGAAAGAYALGRALGASRAVGLLCALWYVWSPFLLDEIAAGHVWIIFAYAVFPWLAESIVSRRSLPVQFLLAASTALDVHFIGFDLALIAFAWTCGYRQSRGALLGLFAFLPTAVADLSAMRSNAFAGQRIDAFYAWVNSTNLVDSIRQVGYAAGYDRLGRNFIVDAALFVQPIIVLMACRAKKFFGPILWLFGALFVSGTRGPFASVLLLLLKTTAAASLYREFFDFGAMTSLGVCAALASLRFNRGQLVAGYVITFVALSPSVLAAYSPLLQFYSPSVTALDSIHEIESSSNRSLVFAHPAQPPLSTGDFRGGVDPLGGRIGAHGMINGDHEFNPLARAFQHDASIMSRYNVGFHIYRNGWTSLALSRLEPGFHERRVARSSPPPKVEEHWNVMRVAAAGRVLLRGELRCETGTFSAVQRDAVVFNGTDPRCSSPGFDPAQENRLTPYPSQGWVDYGPIWFVAPWAKDALPGSIITTTASARVPLPNHCDPSIKYVYVVLHKGPPSLQNMTGCRALAVPGPVVVEPPVMPAMVQATPSPQGSVHTILESSPFVIAEGRLDGDALLQLNSSFSPYWIAVGADGIKLGAHVQVDGAMNGWETHGRGTFRVYLLYAPLLIILPMECLLLIAQAIAIADVVRRSFVRSARQ